jgi:hypothetical protein
MLSDPTLRRENGRNPITPRRRIYTQEPTLEKWLRQSQSRFLQFLRPGQAMPPQLLPSPWSGRDLSFQGFAERLNSGEFEILGPTSRM